MSFSVVYLVNRFFYRIIDFLKHWYINSFLIFSHRSLNVLENLDRRIALRITLRYFFKPLYQDYTFIGYFFGFLFRFFRVVGGLAVYFLLALAAFGLYLLWAAIPIWILLRIFN